MQENKYCKMLIFTGVPMWVGKWIAGLVYKIYKGRKMTEERRNGENDGSFRKI